MKPVKNKRHDIRRRANRKSQKPEDPGSTSLKYWMKIKQNKIRDQLRILHAVKIVFKEWRQNKDCFIWMKLSIFVASKPALCKVLKEFLQAEEKWY